MGQVLGFRIPLAAVHSRRQIKRRNNRVVRNISIIGKGWIKKALRREHVRGPRSPQLIPQMTSDLSSLSFDKQGVRF